MTDLQQLSKLELVNIWTNYAKYCEYVHNGYWKPARHLDIVCKKLEAVERGEIKRLMIFMPPRHGKSMTVTETFPSFFIAKNPDRRVIEASYGDSLAQRFGKMNRQKISEYGESLFGAKLSSEKSSMTDWDIEKYNQKTKKYEPARGGMISVGIGGGITGQGADLLIIDDPVKNREEANSEVYRNKIWDEWQNTLLTRLHPGAAVIIILTRWHEDDLAGRLQNPEYGPVDDWNIVSLPAEAEENDVLGREVGEPLWEEHGYDKDWLDRQRKAVGSTTWTALYQQRPTPAEGGMIKRHWWRFYYEIPSINSFDEIVQSWDMAFKDTNKSDFVVGQVWGRIKADKYLLDQVRARMDFPTTVQAVRNLTAKWPQTMYRIVEDKANGSAVIATLNRELGGMIAENPEGSKEARMAAVSYTIEAGNVYLPSPTIAPWINDYLEEMSAFPKGAHDDMCDATSQSLKRLNLYKANEVKLSEKEKKLVEVEQKFGKHSVNYTIAQNLFGGEEVRDVYDFL